MKLVFASDSFKGSLSSGEIPALLREAAAEVFPGCETAGMPIADGGEGTVEAVLMAAGGTLRKIPVKGPLFEEREAAWLRMPDGTAVIEMAAAAGLTMVPEEKRDPLCTTTFGVGQLILDAARCGCTNILVGLGGSATNDGGMGALAAMGVRFLDESGQLLPGTGASLEKAAAVDRSGFAGLPDGCRVTMICDVENPLTGPEGASCVFAPQKGADAGCVRRLEAGMRRFAALCERELGRSCAEDPGSGAAGGLGFGLRLFLGAERRSGIGAVLDLAGFDRMLENADLVVTGEGRLDRQSVYGKAVSGVAARCKKAGVPVVVLAGSLGEGWEQILDCGVLSVMPVVDRPMPLSEAMERAGELYKSAAVRMFRMLRCGMELAGHR